MGCQDKEISILFTDDEHISYLNRKYLNRKGPTNVIAFPLLEKEDEEMGIRVLGDIIVSVDTAKREAEEAGIDLEERLLRLVIHGILHLLGYDHERSPEEEERMQKEEERLLKIAKEVL